MRIRLWLFPVVLAMAAQKDLPPDIVRDPLQRFYVLLSDEQRERFNAMGTSGGTQAPAGGNVVALCSQQSNDVTKMPAQRIEEVNERAGRAQLRAHARTERGNE